MTAAPTRRAASGLAAAAWLALCTPAGAQPLQPIAIGLGSGSLTGGTARIAKELGLFEKHGFDARLTVMDSGSAAITGLLGGSFKLVVCGPGDLLTVKARGQDVVAVVSTYRGLGANLVISKAVAGRLGLAPGAPVAARLKAMDGLLIGTTSPTTVATIALKKAAEAVGATLRFTYLSQPTFFAALETGAIQGHIGGAPFWARSIVSGIGVEWINGGKGEFPADAAPSVSSLLATTRAMAGAEPELVKRVAAVFAALGDAVTQRPDEVKAAIAKLYPGLDQPTVDLLFDSEAGAWTPSPVTAPQLAYEIAFLKSIGTPPPGIEGVDPASMVFR